MTAEKLLKLEEKVLIEAGIFPVTKEVISQYRDNRELRLITGCDGKVYLRFYDSERKGKSNLVCMDIESEKFVSLGSAMDLFEISNGFAEEIEIAQKNLFQDAGISRRWLDIHFNEILEENESYLEFDCDNCGNEYFIYHKTGHCVWIDTGELIKVGELDRDDIYEKYQIGEYVVVGVPYQYI